MPSSPPEDPTFRLLRSSFRVHESTPLPEPPRDPQAIELHGEMTAYDAEVSGYIARILDGERFRLRVVGPNRRLAQRIQSLRTRRPDLAPVIQRYEDVYNRLQGMINLALKISRSGSRRLR